MRKGTTHSLESIEKMKNSLKGKIPWNKGLTKEDHSSIGKTGFQKGHPFYKGGEKTWFTSEQMKGNQVNKGRIPWNLDKEMPQIQKENHWNWQGGKIRVVYTSAFRRRIREFIYVRDNYTCQLCGDKFGRRKLKDRNFITAHHIDYNVKNNDLINLIALCSLCNISVNRNRKEWTKYFKTKLAPMVQEVI